MPGGLRHVSDANSSSINYWAGYQTAAGRGAEFYGGSARINAWDLELKPDQTSSSVMWLSSGNNQIMSGFMVSAEQYNDTDLHFFVSWTADGFNATGCMDTDCQGFVGSTPPASVSPGSTVTPTSVYHGNQTEYTVTILQVAGNWSLIVDASGENETVGYLPGSLFTGLAGHATVVGWGGNAQSSSGAGPPMGSGHGPDEGDGGAAYVASIAVYDSKGSATAPAAGNVTSLTDAGDCYGASDYEVAKDGGGFFYYGGPQGCNH